jgi:hypothetical protein
MNVTSGPNNKRKVPRSSRQRGETQQPALLYIRWSLVKNNRQRFLVELSPISVAEGGGDIAVPPNVEVRQRLAQSAMTCRSTEPQQGPHGFESRVTSAFTLCIGPAHGKETRPAWIRVRTRETRFRHWSLVTSLGPLDRPIRKDLHSVYSIIGEHSWYSHA